MNQLLAVYDAGVIDRDTLDLSILEEIRRGSMLSSWESVRVDLTGRRAGYLVEFRMWDRKGYIGGMWCTIAENIIPQRSE
jgi:hypothetical protein